MLKRCGPCGFRIYFLHSVSQETAKPELPAAGQKLIHSGKVLKDGDTIASCGVKANDFLVVMVTKAKKAATPKAAAPTPAPKAAAAEAATPAPVAASSTTTTPAAPPAPVRTDDFPQEAVDNLTAMGFPEPEVKHCLRAAQGNPDVAVEFLTNGIPDSVNQIMQSSSGGAPTPAASNTASGTGASSSAQPLQALRNHPQFNDLRRLVQSNPQMLQQVLGQIGQQQPELLQEINANQALFLEMMNEPIAPGSSSSGGSANASSMSNAAAAAGLPEGMGNPAQMAQMIQSMSPEELERMSQMMGLSPEQLRMTAQMLGQMPPEQLQQFMMQAMGSGGAGMPGGGGQQVLRLSPEEMAAVDRLTEMGFDRSEAAQAFLACDKNEALAANLLMDSMAGGGFFGGGGGDSGNNDNNDSGGGGSGGNDNDDEMYD